MGLSQKSEQDLMGLSHQSELGLMGLSHQSELGLIKSLILMGDIKKILYNIF